MPTPLLQGQRSRAVLCRRRVLDFNHCLGAGGVAANDGVQSGPGPQLRVSHVYDSPRCL